jgi:hypothetical protein
MVVSPVKTSKLADHFGATNRAGTGSIGDMRRSVILHLGA